MKLSKIISLVPCFWLPILIFLAHLFIIIPLNLYGTYEWLDIPMHFIGGASIAYSVILILNKCREEIVIKDKLVNAVAIVALVGLVAIFWEFGEFLTGFQGDLNDTLSDFVMGLTGGLVVALRVITK